MNLSMNKYKDKKIKKIHFIGIGGIGMSAIVRMMILSGKEVSGSDTASSIVSDGLKKLGARIFIGHNENNLKDPDLVIYTTAIAPDNPEFQKARKLRIPIYSYPEMLGFITRDKFTIAVSGTHGKTTTTAMLAEVLINAKFEPTVIVGSLLKGEGSNFIAGKSKYFVTEGCEYRRAFLNLNPKMIIITNIDEDHLDYYKDLADIQNAFLEFVSKLGRDGILICNTKDKNLRKILSAAKCRVVDYSSEKIDFKLKVPGRHNIENAKAVFATARFLDIDRKIVKNSLKNFLGTWRRFEYKGKTENGVLIYDDYAHHPTEIKVTLRGAREFFGKKKIFCVFQPHLFSRTWLLLNDFAQSFDDADQIIVIDIYAAREDDDGKIHSKDLVEKIKEFNKNVAYGGSFKKIEEYLQKRAKTGEIILTMGAGDVYKIGDKLLLDI